MSKQFTLMRDVITRYHPAFVASKDLQQYGLNNAELFNVERLIEESLAAVGPYQFVDQEGYDFTDYSDSKTTTVNQKTRRVEVNSVENKIGALRITAYNPHIGGLHYFFVPKSKLDYVRSDCYGINEYKKRIQFTWRTDDDYGWFEDFRVNSFELLARMPG